MQKTIKFLSSLVLLLITAMLSLSDVVTLGLFKRKRKAVVPQSSSQHADDTRKPVRGALDRNKRKKTEDRTPIVNEKKAVAGHKV